METFDSNLVLILFCLPLLGFAGLLVWFFRVLRPHKRRAGWPRLIAGNLLVLLFLLSALLLSGEFYYRFVYDSTDSFGLTKTTRRWFDRHFRYNAVGFRDSIDYSRQREPGRRRITVLGDSFTVGHGIADVERRFANQLRALQGDVEIHVIANAGWDTGRHVELLTAMARDGYEFDTVVLVYCLNDIADIVPQWQAILHRIYEESQPGYVVQHSYFLNSWYYRWKAARDPDVADYYQFVQRGYQGEIWQRQQHRLRDLLEAVRAADGELLVVTFPFVHALGPDYAYRDIHAALDAFWTELEVPHLDLINAYEGYAADQLTVNRYDAHPNEDAHEIAAQAIDRFLEDVLQPPSSAEPPPAPPLPLVRSPEFQNSASEVGYVGSRVCSECHPAQAESYRQTQHSEALAEIDLDAEPPDGEFEHQLSRRTYRVYRQEGELRHRESLRLADGQELVLADFPMRYVIGSGHHSRSYLVEIDGFLCESPVTWFASRQAWGMSPGFEENPLPQSFSRPARVECLACHAGRVEPVDGALHRLQLHELAIGCESCHGPGQLHVERHAQSSPLETGHDSTIVHPGRLDRERAEAICARCHLGTFAQAPVRGRSLSEFRPGQHLTDFVATYRWDAPPSSMTVVGHVEQMRLSRCYQASSSMTCTTCHDPHARPGAGQRVGYFRARCLGCHEPPDCGLDESQRLQQNSEDNCVACHMPRSDTDIPHFAFTHHRVAVHTERPGGSQDARPDKLVPLHDLSHLSPLDRDRCLGLAYLALTEDAELAAQSPVHVERARQLLERVYEQGLRDPEVQTGLARITRSTVRSRAVELARSALESRLLRPITRTDALNTLSRSQFDLGRYRQAIAALERLIPLRRDAEDHLLAAVSHARAGNLPLALDNAQQAAQIEPDRPDLQELLAELYRHAGDLESARHHARRASLLRQALPASFGAQAPSGQRGNFGGNQVP